MVQWLRLHASSVGGPGLMSSQGTRYHIPQLKDLASCHYDLVQEINIKKERKKEPWQGKQVYLNPFCRNHIISEKFQ